jgi:hypothetical protein
MNTVRDLWVEVEGRTWTQEHVRPFLAQYPYWACVGKEDRNLRLVFDSQPLEPFIQSLAADQTNRDGVALVDLAKSNLIFLRRTAEAFKTEGDPIRDEVIAKYRSKMEKYEGRFERNEYVGLSPQTQPYWFSLLCGLAEMRSLGRLTPENIYYRWWLRGVNAKKIDPGLAAELPTEELRLARLSDRLAAMLDGIQARTSNFDRPIAYNPGPDSSTFMADEREYRTIHTDGKDLFFTDLDGHHRLFFSQLLGFNQIEMQLTWYPALPGMDRARQKYPYYETMMEEYLAEEVPYELDSVSTALQIGAKV